MAGEMTNGTTGREPWHLDRRVPIALILTILAQSVTAGWFAASFVGRVETLERDVERNRQLDARQETAIRAIETGAARLDEKLDGILDAVERMDRRLERMISSGG